MKVKLLAYTPNPERLIAQAAKLCYSPSDIEEIESKLTEKETESFLLRLIADDFLSPFEHVHFTFAIENISRNTTHQLVRHRTGSFSQQSARHVKFDPVEYIVPESFQKNEHIMKIFDGLIKDTSQAYQDITTELLLQQIDIYIKNHGLNDMNVSEFRVEYPKLYRKFEKYAIEDARSVLMTSLSSKIIITMDARNLFNFFNLRCCKKAQLEIREVAWEMLKQVKEIAPIIFSQAGARCAKGLCHECNIKYQIAE